MSMPEMPSGPTRNPLHNIYLGVVIVMAVGLLIVALLVAILTRSRGSQKITSGPAAETNQGTKGAPGVEKIEAAPLQQIREATPEP